MSVRNDFDAGCRLSAGASLGPHVDRVLMAPGADPARLSAESASPDVLERAVNIASNVVVAAGGLAFLADGNPGWAATAGAIAALGNSRSNPVTTMLNAASAALSTGLNVLTGAAALVRRLPAAFSGTVALFKAVPGEIDLPPKMHPGVDVEPAGADAMSQWSHMRAMRYRRALGAEPLTPLRSDDLKGTPLQHARLVASGALVGVVAWQTASSIASVPEALAVLGALRLGIKHADWILNYRHHRADACIGTTDEEIYALRHHFLAGEVGREAPAQYLSGYTKAWTAGLALTALAPYMGIELPAAQYTEPVLNVLKTYLTTFLVGAPVGLMTHAWAHRGKNVPAWLTWLRNAPNVAGEFLEERDLPRLAHWVRSTPFVLDNKLHLEHHNHSEGHYSGLTGENIHTFENGDPDFPGRPLRYMEMIRYLVRGDVSLIWLDHPDVMAKAFTLEDEVKSSLWYKAWKSVSKHSGPSAEVDRLIREVIARHEVSAPEAGS